MRDYNKAHTYCPSHNKFRPFDITGGKILHTCFENFKKGWYYGSLLFVFGRLRYQLTTVVIEYIHVPREKVWQTLTRFR